MSTDAHVCKTTGNTLKNINLFHFGASVVNAWRIDDHDELPADLGLDDVDIAGA